MKKCEKCGWVTGNPADSFCEKCGGRLTEMPEKEAGDSQGKKGVLPIIAGCAAVAVLLIAGTVIGIRMMGEGKQEQTAQTAETETEKEPENSQTTLEEKEPDVQTEANSETQTQDVAGGAREEIQDFQVPETGQEGSSENSDQVAEEKEQASAAAGDDVSEAAENTAGEGETQSMKSDIQEQRYETCFVVNCKESITLRKSPSTKAEECCQIPLGAAVSYVGTAENGFYQVIYNGQTGYALASYLSFENEQDSQQQGTTYMEVVNCKESITLRKTPSTRGEEFCQIPLGAMVEYKGTAENGFYMVVYNGYTGYALASYLTER